jgi:hypothetical protein
VTVEPVPVRWTLERANRALPLVRRIADDLVRTHAEWQALVGEFELVAAGHSPAHPVPEAERLQGVIQRLAGDIDGFLRELAELGVECKSIESGLMDFPAEREGREVYLCWRRGEPAVAHWHERDSGFAGRAPVDDDFDG